MRSVPQRLIMYAGLLAAPVATSGSQPVPPEPRNSSDPRLVRLKQFLSQRDCPLTRFAADFIEAADRNHLDWRLLPSISYVESSGGKNYRNNNVFGWNSSKGRFSSIPEAIHFVADRLGASRLYRNKSLEQKLHVYNPRVEYSAHIRSVMRSISVQTQRYAAVN